jgi:formylglycine-generating enzyme required for sulfatase activity
VAKAYLGPNADHQPVVCVDWCDGLEYCAGVGKRLCGGLRGGASAYVNADNSYTSQWASACSKDGNRIFPYVGAYQPDACNGLDHGLGKPLPVGSLASCQGGYNGVYDMSGNVWEWENSCDTPSANQCHIRGGAFDTSTLACSLSGLNYAPSNSAPDIGFRCCEDEASAGGAGGTSAGGAAGTSSAGGAGSGGVGGVGGVGGSSGMDGTGCTGGLETRSNGLCVAEMASIPGPAEYAPYSIDVTEVTRGQYAAWLATNPAPIPVSDPICGVSNFGAPDPDCELTDYQGADTDHHPVVCVNYCDAHAYCAGVGKRLCGAIGGGSLPDQYYANSRAAQWYRACSLDALSDYPYGEAFDSEACNSALLASAPLTTTAVGSLPNCQATAVGYQGVYDLSGNVAEWQDECSAGLSHGSPIDCAQNGGNFAGSDLRVQCLQHDLAQFSSATRYVGFRCCSE